MKKIVSLTAVLLLAAMLGSCGNLVSLTDRNGMLENREESIMYAYAPICFEPIRLAEEPYAKCASLKMKYYEVIGQTVSDWISEPYAGIGGLYYNIDTVELPTLAEFEPAQVIVCVEDTITGGRAIVSEQADTAAIAAAFTEGEPTSIVQAGTSYKLKFSSDKEEYAGIYYNLIYVEGDDGENYIYDRSTKTCVNVGDVLQKYLPRPTEG